MKRLLLPLLAALALPTAVNTELWQKTDDFENSTTWVFMFASKNKMLFDAGHSVGNLNRDREYKAYAYLKLTCKKYADKNYYVRDELLLMPPAPIVNNGKVEIKFDNLTPQVQNLINDREQNMYTGYFSFWDTKKLIYGLYEHSTLKLRYQTTRGTQIAEFVLDNKKDIAEFWNKCY